MNITFLTETTLERETSGATPVQDLLGNTGPLRLTLAVTAIGNTYSPPGPGLRRGRTVLEVSVEDSPDGESDWRTIHTFRDHTYPDGDPGIGEQRAALGGFQRFVRARFRLRSLTGGGNPTATIAITGSAPTAAAEE